MQRYVSPAPATHAGIARAVGSSVIVISDRTVLDTQLREAIESFERTRGVVAVVTGEGASKSKELAEVQDGGEISTEDILAAQMSAKANADEKAGITYVAFTATPKEKTLQLFGTPGDKLVYVNDVIRGKLMESEKLIEQAMNNTKEQFANSPDLTHELINAVMDALTAHSAMSKQALESEKLRNDMKDVLLGVGRLWEGLRERGRGA